MLSGHDDSEKMVTLVIDLKAPLTVCENIPLADHK